MDYEIEFRLQHSDNLISENLCNYNPARHHRLSIRLKEYDYSSENLFFITICNYDRKSIFGNFTDGVMILNELEDTAKNEWLNSTVIRSEIELPKKYRDFYQQSGKRDFHKDLQMKIINKQRKPTIKGIKPIIWK
jgi:hypothetical protein